MDKFLEMLLGEAFKLGIKKLSGHQPERHSDAGGSLGCLVIILMGISYPIGIYWLKPRLTTGSFWYEHIYTWPLYFFGLWMAYYLLRFVLYCLKEAPFHTLLFVGFIWSVWYAHHKGWI